MTREEFIKEVRKIAEGNLYTHDPMSTKQPPIYGYESLEMEAGDLYDRMPKETPKQTCDKCDAEIEICDGCGESYCPYCDEGCGTDGGGNSLCSGCMTAAGDEWKRETENGKNVCATCAHFSNEDADGDGDCALDEYDPRHNGYCERWVAKVE